MPLNTYAHCLVKDGQDKHLTVSTDAQSELLIGYLVCAKYQDKAARDLRQFVMNLAEPGNN